MNYHLATASVNQTPLDWDANFQRLSDCINEAKRRGATLLLLPDFALCGYGCEDAFFRPQFHQLSLEYLGKLALLADEITLLIGTPLRHFGKLYKGVALLADTKVAGIACRKHLAESELHYEKRWFHPWQPGLQKTLQLKGESIPIGDLTFDLEGIQIAIKDRSTTELSDPPHLLVDPGTDLFTFERQTARQNLYHHQSIYLYSNLNGNEAGRAIYDGGARITDRNKLVGEGERLHFKQWDLVDAIVEIPSTQPIATALKVNSRLKPSSQPPSSPLTCDPSSKERDLTRAVSLGIWDYLRKSRAHGLVLSASGGADSSAVAVLTFYSLHYALQTLSKEEVVTELPWLEPQKPLMQQLLTMVYQGSPHSSETTLKAAQSLAQEIGAEFFCWNIQPMIENYQKQVQSSLNRELSWKEDDKALQNIQARVRAPGVWMLANIKNALLLATSNRSEVAVGYATMDGDTCGGIAPIAGVDKHYLRHWLHTVHQQGIDGAPPLKSLELVLEQAPTAELRPREQNQTDEADLMPYRYLDQIERMAILERHSPLEIYRKLNQEIEEASSQEIARWVDRFFRLWCQNQWKRERYAPGFHLDTYNLDPKSWCRFPILSGLFKKELETLQKYL